MHYLETVYIALLNEGTSVWRPTLGEKIQESVYKILPTDNYDPNDEEWAYPPGSIVRCEMQMHGSGSKREQVLVAVELFSPL